MNIHIRAQPFALNLKPTDVDPTLRVLCGAERVDPGNIALSHAAAKEEAVRRQWAVCRACLKEIQRDPARRESVTEGTLRTIAPQTSQSDTESVITAGAGDVGVSITEEQMNLLYEAGGDSATIQAIVTTAPRDDRAPRIFAALEAGGTMYGRTEIVGQGDVVRIKTGQRVSLRIQLA